MKNCREMRHSAVAKVGTCSIIYKSINQKEPIRFKRKQNILKYQTHEHSYIEDGNITCGLLLPLENMCDCEEKKQSKIFRKIFRI